MKGSSSTAIELSLRCFNFRSNLMLLGMALGLSSFVMMAGAELTPVELLLNGGFEQGVPSAPWAESTLRGRELVERSGPDGGPHDGNWQAKLGGSNNEHDVISQMVILPIGAASASLSFWYSIKSTGNAQDDAPLDSLSVEIRDIDGNLIRVLKTLTSADQTSGWTHSSTLPLNDLIGQVFAVTFSATTNKTKPTFFFVDDVSLTFLPSGSPGQMSFAFINPRTGCLGGGGRIPPEVAGIVPVEVVAASTDGVSSLSLTLDGQMIGTTSSSHLIVDVDSSLLSSGSHTLEAVGTSTLGTTGRCPAPITPLPLLRNGDFEEALTSPSAMWFKDDVMSSENAPVFAAGALLPAYSGSNVARLGGAPNRADSLNQLISFPLQGGIATLTFYSRVASDRTTIQDVDHLTVSITNPYGGGDPVSLVTLSNLNRSPLALSTGGGFTLYRFDIDLAATGLAGTIGQLTFNSQTAGGNGTTSFLIDAVGFTVTAPPDPVTTSVTIWKPMTESPATGTSPFLPVDLTTLKSFGAGIVSEYESYYVGKVATSNLSTFLSNASAYYVEPSPDFDRVRVNGYDFTSGSAPPTTPANLTITDYSGPTGLYVVQLAGPARWEWEQALRAIGTPVEYLPENGYIVRSSPSRAQFLRYRPFVKSTTVYQPAYKVLNSLLSQGGAFQVLVQLDGEVDLTNAKAILESINNGPIYYEDTGSMRNTTVKVSSFDLPTIAALPEVLWIEYPIGPTLSDEGIALSVAGKVTLDGTGPASPGTFQNWLTESGQGFCTPSSHPANCTDYSGLGAVAFFDSGLDVNICNPSSDANCQNETGICTSGSTFSRHPDLCNTAQNHEIQFFCATTPAGTNLCHNPYSGNPGVLDYSDYCAHGTATASILVGDPVAGTHLKDSNGYYYGGGIAPSAKLIEFKINGLPNPSNVGSCDFLPDPANLGSPYVPSPADWARYYNTVYNAGARFANNSWNNYGLSETLPGQTSQTSIQWSYNLYSRKMDQLVRDSTGTGSYHSPMVVAISAGNQNQSNASTDKSTWFPYVVAPATAKNVMTAGSAEGFRSIASDPDFSGDFACGNANSFKNVLAVSGRGVQGRPGRFKPDLLAPTSRAAVAYTRSSTDAFKGHGCVEPPPDPCDTGNPGSPHCPVEGGYYVRFESTSGAAPVVLGAAVLTNAWLAKHQFPGMSGAPSPAMVKALLMAHAADISGGSYTSGYGPLPNNTPLGTTVPSRPNPHEGWGRVELNQGKGAGIAPSLFQTDVTPTFFDEDHGTTPTRRFVKSSSTSLQAWSKNFQVIDSSKEVIIALAWTDAPGKDNTGDTSVSPAVNNLDLRVVDSNPVQSTSRAASQPLYRLGNKMSGGYSNVYLNIPPGDTDNNVEIIRVAAGKFISNDFLLSVIPTSITMQGVPGLDASYPNQDWALYVYNAKLQ